MTGGPWNPCRSGGPCRSRVPSLVFGLAVLVTLVVAGYQIMVGARAVSPGDAEPVRIPLGPTQTVAALSFLLWPALAGWGALQRNVAVVWLATGLHLAFSFLLVFSFGGHHLVFGAPLMLLGAIWRSVR